MHQHTTPRFFHQLVRPIMEWLPQLTQEWQGDFGYRKFFTHTHVLLSLFAHLSRAEGANDLAAQLGDDTLTTVQLVEHTTGALSTSSLSRAKATRPYQIWQALFLKLYQKPLLTSPGSS